MLKKKYRMLQNKKGIESGGFSFVVKVAMALLIGGLFFWMVIKALGKFG